MTPFFRKVTGKTCKHDDCSLQGQPLELSQTHCEQCGRPLLGLTAPNRFRQLLAVLVTSGVLAGSGFEAVKYFRPQVLQVEVLPPGATTIQEGVAPPLSAEEAQRRLGAKLREIYRDCKAGEEEKAETEKLLASHPEFARVYPELERARLPHILESCRLVRTGQTLVAQKLYGHARTDFLRATEEDPENANAWAALGGANMLTRREAEASQAYERALAVDPESWIAHYNYGFYFARKGEAEAAFLHLNQAVDLLGRSGNVDRTAVLDDLRQNPVLDPLRRDPRFAKLLG